MINYVWLYSYHIDDVFISIIFLSMLMSLLYQSILCPTLLLNFRSQDRKYIWIIQIISFIALIINVFILPLLEQKDSLFLIAIYLIFFVIELWVIVKHINKIFFMNHENTIDVLENVNKYFDIESDVELNKMNWKLFFCVLGSFIMRDNNIIYNVIIFLIVFLIEIYILSMIYKKMRCSEKKSICCALLFYIIQIYVLFAHYIFYYPESFDYFYVALSLLPFWMIIRKDGEIN